MNEIPSLVVKKIVMDAVDSVCNENNINYRNTSDTIIIDTKHDQIKKIEANIDLYIMKNYKRIIEEETKDDIKNFNTTALKYYEIYNAYEIDTDISNKYSTIIKY
jgi:hypothetical protein